MEKEEYGIASVWNARKNTLERERCKGKKR